MLLKWKKCMLPMRRFGWHCWWIQILLHFTYNLTHQYLTAKNYIFVEEKMII